MPTGGVSLEYDNLKSWFDSGVTCVGIGSKLISNDILETKNYDLLKRNVQETLKTIKLFK
jgi:2-dehydro-3-deoxyphosphogluconate aldolase/(4S)-4-hydroxy-2-oxoglutarate aldolase